MVERLSDADERPLKVGITERDVIDALPRAVVLTDPNGSILLWNLAAERLFGWAEIDVIGKSVLDVLAPIDDLDANRADLEAVAAGNRASGDRVVRRADGSVVRISTSTRPLCDSTGAVVAILGLSEDVAGIRLAEQQARDLTEHFGSALEAGGLGTWRWEMATGVTIWDERLEALFGLAPGGFDGTFETYVSLLHPDDRDEVLDRVRQAVESKRPYRVDHRVVWPDGSVHWISGAGAVTLDEHGAVTGTVGCSADITARIAQEEELQRLAEVAKEAADNERLQRERLEFLGAINDALQASSTVHDVMRNVTKRSVPRLGDWCAIHVLPFNDGSTPDVEIAHSDPSMLAYARELQAQFPFDPQAPAGVAWVIRTGQAEFYPDITEDVIAGLDLTDAARDAVAHLALRSSICVPLIKRGRVLGAIQFVMSSSSRRYTEDDVVLARTVADRIASSVENLRLQDQQRLIAHTLQKSLLPAALPAIPGVEIAVRYWPAGESYDVGGDFYDVFSLKEEGRWAVVVGDVCGTGPAAAALTGLARHSIRASAWHGDSPSEVLTSLNHAVLNSSTDSYLTAVYATLDADDVDLTLTIACGGHPPPIHVTRAASTTLDAPGRLLGLFEQITIEQRVTHLEPGDVVVFYTDGATDVPPPHWLTYERWMEIVTAAARGSATASTVADRLHHALEAELAFKERDDDIALLILRVTECD